MYPKIIEAIEGGNWAITAEALQGILKISQRDFSAEDYKIFHAASEARKDAIVADLGERVPGTRYSYVNGSVGLMYVDGPIIPRADGFSDVSGMTSIEGLHSDLRALNADDDVKEIVLVMDSPGGNVVGISEMSQAIKNSSKPVDAFVYGMAASAGYWIASAARNIYIVDTGEVGSIGVVATYRDRSAADADRGIKTIEIVSSQSPHKRPDLSTEGGKAQVQGTVDDLADVFVGTVATNRKTTPEGVLAQFGQGALLVGQKAVDAGMADQVTTLEALINKKNGETSKNGGSNVILTVDESNTNNAKAEEKFMAENNEKTLTAEEVAKMYPSAVAELNQKAVADDRARIQAIEAITASVSNMGPGAVAAAQKVVMDNKFDGNMDANAVSGLVLGAVNTAQKTITAATVADAMAAGMSAEDIPGAGDDENGGTVDENNQADEQATAEDIAAGM